jgi:hypothetical protein
MYFGFAFLYLLAVGFYSLAWAFSRKSISLGGHRAAVAPLLAGAAGRSPGA